MKTKIYANLKNKSSMVPFDESMLPNEISLEYLYKSLEFLSPVLLILHGSSVSKKRYSPVGDADLDIICVTIKSGFWSFDNLYEKFQENTKNVTIKIDLTILTCSRFLSVLEENSSSLSYSLGNGFTVLWRD